MHLVLAAEPTDFREVTCHQFSILNRMGMPTSMNFPSFSSDLIIDAQLGYRIKGNPRESYASLITYANETMILILALEIPSGLEPNNGKPYNPCIRANTILTLALPKTGLVIPQAQPYVRQLYLADIGISCAVYTEVTKQEPPSLLNTPLLDFSNL